MTADWPNLVLSLPPLRDVIRAFDLAAKKSLGQNFLLDLNITDKIARAAGELDAINVIEIGPGPGGLTRALVARAKSVTAIERDSRCIAALQSLVVASNGALNLLEGDAQVVDYAALVPAPRAIIANLPYNIGTDLLIGWLQQGHLYQSLTLMFQQEVAERIVATPAQRAAYGRLAVMVQATATARIVMKLPPHAFTPPPKVSSAVVHIVPRAVPLAPLDALEKVTAAAFGQRRKMIKSSLAPIFSEEKLAELGLNLQLRPEQLPPESFFMLAKALAESD